MTADGFGPDHATAILLERLALAEETLRALRAGEVDAIVMDAHKGEQQIYTLDTEDRPYRRLVEGMSEGAALVDADGLVVYANHRLALLLGLPLEQLLGRPFSDWLDEPDGSLFIERLASPASGGHEHTLHRVDGVSLPVLVGVNVTQEPDGLLRCLTVTDLSLQKAQQQQVDRLNTQLMDRLAELRALNGDLDVERIRVEEANAELKAVNAELEVVNEAMRSFTAAAAHDLRSPLQSIMGFATLLTDKWTTIGEQERRKFVAIIERQSKNLSNLVDDLLTVSIIEGGALTTRPVSIVVSEAISQCLEASVEDTTSVSVSCAPDLVVQADPAHLGRILDNYLNNAFKYGDPPIRIEASRAGSLVQVRVLDAGSGVPPDFVSRLFDKFARADTPGTRAKKGTGLGLSIVRALAEANGGQARFEPNTPQGACFVVEFLSGGGAP